MHHHALHKLRNVLHSAVLIAGMCLIAAGCAWILWGVDGMLWAIAGFALATAISPTVPASFVLSLYRARPLSQYEFPAGYAILNELSRRAELPATPKLYYLPSALLNAFAVGTRRSAAIAVTDGMLRHMSLRELSGVLAHEVSHIANQDLWIMNLADAMSRATTLLAYIGMFLLLINLPLMATGAVMVPWMLVLLLMLAPTLMSLLQLALSRSREYDADLDAARLANDPQGLALALVKLERYQGRFWESVLLPGRRVPEPSLLRTHPPTEERVRRLMNLDRSGHESRVLPRGREQRLVPPRGIRHIHSAPRWHWSGLWY